MKFNTNVYMNEEGGEAPAGGGDASVDGGGEAPAADLGNDNGGDVIDGGEHGDGKELFAGKYKTTEELEKGYKESVAMGTKNAEKMNSMSEKLKGFAGAPEGDYEALEGFDGYSDPVMGSIQEWGKEQGLSQDAYNSLLGKVSEAEATNREAHIAQEMSKIGKDADIRIKNTNDKLVAIFGEELASEYQNIGTSAAGFNALENLVARFGDGTVNPDGGDFSAEPAITQDDLATLMNKKDSAGTPLMQASPEYAKKVYGEIAKYNKQHGIG